MAMKIRLARGGSKKRPFYSIVASDSRMPRDGRFIEKLGTYNPLLAKDSEDRVKMNMERVKYWLEQGAQPTDRVSRFLEAAGVLAAKPATTRTKLFQAKRHKSAQKKKPLRPQKQPHLHLPQKRRPQKRPLLKKQLHLKKRLPLRKPQKKQRLSNQPPALPPLVMSWGQGGLRAKRRCGFEYLKCAA